MAATSAIEVLKTARDVARMRRQVQRSNSELKQILGQLDDSD